MIVKPKKAFTLIELLVVIARSLSDEAIIILIASQSQVARNDVFYLTFNVNSQAQKKSEALSGGQAIHLVFILGSIVFAN